MAKCGRAYELMIVADGVSVPDGAGTTVLQHDMPRGYGACVRTALPAIQHPLVLLTADDYPYTPADLAKLLKVIETPGEMPDPKTGEWGLRTPDLVVGARTGVPEPGLLRFGGAVFRTFCKLALDLTQERWPGWYGVGETAKTWRSWLTFGVPLHDPHCGYKLVRKELLDRFPLQCDGDLFHIELIAKATFLTCMLDEVPLSPKPDRVPKTVWAKADKKVLWGKPQFAHLPEPPAVSPPVSVAP